jgi:NAD(P)-dependent dehydrogenase (short-subunit alcohol dehydrogenase family)
MSEEAAQGEVGAMVVDPIRVDGRVALVTGAASGIGAATVSRLATRGADVAVCDLNLDAATALAEQISSSTSRSVRAFALDVRRGEECSRCVAEVANHFGRIDYLVNSAGVMSRLDANDTSDEVWHELLEINLHGTIRMCHEAGPWLARQQGSAVVNLGSTNGAVAVPLSAAYGVSKAGIHHLTRILAFEWARNGVRVNAVAPTIVETPMTADIREDPSYLEAKLAAIPLGRMVTPREVAEVVAWLCSQASAMVTGQIIFIDGGFTIV